jgi:hypothetical protein
MLFIVFEMSAPKFMNEILYNQKNFLKSQENFLSDLKPYMLVPEVWEKLCAQQPCIDVAVANIIKSTSFEPTSFKPTSFEPTSFKPTSFKPGLRDSVFWCIYVAIHGESCYQSHMKSGTNMINLMMNEKKAISDHFNNNSTLLKNSNQKLTLAKINEIKCNLMTKPVMDSVESFIPCSIYYGRPIFVYFEEIRSYLRFADKNYVSDNDNTDEDNDVSYNDPNVIIILVKDRQITLETNVSNFLEKKDSLFHIQHYDKILSGVSNYKTDEIREIYKKVFGEDADFKKPEYYEKVLVKISTIVNAKI